MWLEYVRTLWPIALVITVFLAGVFALWLRSGFATKLAFDALTKTVGDCATKESMSDLTTALAKNTADHQNDRIDHDLRLQRLEELIETAPTRQELQKDIAALGSRMSGIEKGFDGFSKQLSTTNDYLHTLIEKAIPGAKRP